MTLASLRESVLVKGSPALVALGWNEQWRAGLLDQLETLCGHLWSVGITEIFVDGSFVTDKIHPGDIDGYFICEFDRFRQGQFAELLSLDSAWDINKRLPDKTGKLKPLMWHRYRVELFQHFLPPFSDYSVAMINELGQPVSFPEFFRCGRDGKPRGIVRIIREHSSC